MFPRHDCAAEEEPFEAASLASGSMRRDPARNPKDNQRQWLGAESNRRHEDFRFQKPSPSAVEAGERHEVTAHSQKGWLGATLDAVTENGLVQALTDWGW